MNNRLDEKVYETITAHLTADLIETQTRIRSRVNKTRTLLSFVPDVLISKMKMGLENVVVHTTETTKIFMMFLSTGQLR